jgi:hypothetical protein
MIDDEDEDRQGEAQAPAQPGASAVQQPDDTTSRRKPANRIEAPDAEETASSLRQVAEFAEHLASATVAPATPGPTLFARARAFLQDRGDKEVPAAPIDDDAGDGVPEALRQRYAVHVSDDRKTISLFEKGSKTAAITLDGHSIMTPHNEGVVIADIVALARDRGWQALKISGTAEFKDAVWLEANKAGLTVQHEPSAAIQAHFAKWERDRPENRIQAATPARPDGPARTTGDELGAAFAAKTSEERLADPRFRNAQLELMVGVRTAEKELGRPIADMPDVLQALTAAVRQQLAHGRVFDAPFVKAEQRKAVTRQVTNPKIDADRIPPPRQ